MDDLNQEKQVLNRPAIDFDLMVCIVNSICEVLKINIPITAGDPADLAEMIEIISGKVVTSPTDLHQMSYLLSEIISDRCKDQNDRNQILDLCAKKYIDSILKDQYAFVE
jgi:hypothetical protein